MLSAAPLTSSASLSAARASVASNEGTPMVKVALTVGQTTKIEAQWGFGDQQMMGVERYLKAMGMYMVKGSKTADAFFYHVVACLKQPRPPCK